ncbi:unnamed protein product [Sympodiomycopsis kandeliae]
MRLMKPTLITAMVLAAIDQVTSRHLSIHRTSSRRRLSDDHALCHSSHHRADKEMCGDWDKVQVGPYLLKNNLWNKGAASSAKQCVTLDGSSSNGIQWSSTWSFSGSKDQPKSYPNVETDVKQVQLSKIASIQSKWSWTYTGSSIRADVAYDLFTSDSPGSAKKYEIMIWLARYDVNPIASSYNGDGAVADDENVSVGGHRWKLYKGSNEGATVLSFVPAGGEHMNTFDGDLNVFFKYLVDQKKMPDTQYLLIIGAGSEPFEGQNAKFTTSSYSCEPKYK